MQECRKGLEERRETATPAKEARGQQRATAKQAGDLAMKRRRKVSLCPKRFCVIHSFIPSLIPLPVSTKISGFISIEEEKRTRRESKVKENIVVLVLLCSTYCKALLTE
jgi:hypothetical protein